MRLFVECQLEPLLIGTASDKAPQLINFRFESEQVNRTLRRGRCDAQILWQSLVKRGDELQQPGQAQPRHTTDATQRESFEQQSFDEGAGRVAHTL